MQPGLFQNVCVALLIVNRQVLLHRHDHGAVDFVLIHSAQQVLRCLLLDSAFSDVAVSVKNLHMQQLL